MMISKKKFKGHKLYLLPPSLFPREGLDTLDERYTNYSHAPVPSPLNKPLQIELHTPTFFPSSSAYIQDSITDQPSNIIDSISSLPHIPPQPIKYPKLPNNSLSPAVMNPVS